MHGRETSRASASRIAIALPTDASDSEAMRAMLRERIGLWALWVAILSGGFYIVNVVVWPFTGAPMTLGEMLRGEGAILHALGSLLFAGVWLLTRRVALSLRNLRLLDVCALIAGCAVFSWMGGALAEMQESYGQPPALGTFAGLLASANVVMARAIAVPSTATHTFWASTVAMVPVVIVSWATGGQAENNLSSTITFATWCGVSVAIATVGSRVIFGLRSEAARVRRLGQYTLEEKIGAGGMGVVYRARHAMLRRPTAIKLLPPDRAGEANLVRFEREVQLTAQLSHPNTVAIYDYGRTPDGIFYYAMEYLEGINLEQLVSRDGPQPPGRVAYILRQVCGALGEAHSRGLLHRDIKPANIILTERGGEPDVAKVVDFGLVKPLATSEPDVTMSSSIVLAGTPLYMAPEALTSPAAVDARSDLYAVGAVGYFLLTGQPLFEAATVAEAFGHHLHTQPTPPSERLGRPIPADIEAAILRCLRKNVDERPATAHDLAAELKACDCASRWTSEDAARWWASFRESGAPPRPLAEEIDPGLAITVAVDLSARTSEPTAP
jgi:eukaryotic-like serine/threonine-protein kinase